MNKILHKPRKWLTGLCLSAMFLAGASVGHSALPYLVYDSGGSQDHIVSAMTTLGFTFDVRSASDPVTAGDLTSHSALVIGWSESGYDMSGLDPAILTAGITGNKLITGHDADYHTWAGVAAAQTFMERAVLFAAGSPGKCGILAFPVYSDSPFSYLPSAWGITSFDHLVSETITEVTPDGAASGLYSGLSLAVLSNWGQSFHAGFTSWGSGFNSFEIGTPPEGTVVTIGTTVTPIPGVPDGGSTVLLLGAALALIAGVARKFLA